MGITTKIKCNCVRQLNLNEHVHLKVPKFRDIFKKLVPVHSRQFNFNDENEQC